jgi:MHS family proline/betaine transporter-like MFS transporter
VATGAVQRGSLKLSDWRVIILASLGGALEFYDFVIYGVFAQYIGAAFFPADDPFVSQITTFAVFAIGYGARPLGGIVLSHFGDRYGRRVVFIVTILAMTGSTVAMGLLPTYAQIGVTASIAMVALRFVQGFCLGGELPGAITYVVETAPRRAGFAAGVIFFCVNTGVVIATLLNLGLQSSLDQQQLGEWGWRIAFLVGGALGVVSFLLRLTLGETAEFKRMKHSTVKLPMAQVLGRNGVNVLLGIGVLAGSAGFNGLLFAYIPTYLSQNAGYSALEASQAQNLCLGILSFGLLFAAWLGDRIPRRWILGTGALLALALSLPFFSAVANHSMNLLVLFALAGIVASCLNGACVGIIGDLFPTLIRFSGVALAFNVAFSVGSGVAPLAATSLVGTTGSLTGPAWYMMGCAALTLVAALLVRRFEGHIRRGQTSLAGEDAKAAAASTAS